MLVVIKDFEGVLPVCASGGGELFAARFPPLLPDPGHSHSLGAATAPGSPQHLLGKGGKMRLKAEESL